jgi:hypothetical protein
MRKYTVNITKQDGMKSIYYVVAHSAGGAESMCLNEVYNARYALAEDGWPESVKVPDMYTQAVARDAVYAALNIR